MLYTSPQYVPVNFSRTKVFVAGGISGCGDWQSEIVSVMDTDTFDVYNPRRPEGLAKDGDEAKLQIEWEYRALAVADDVIFWFPKESICPITLLEYGKMLSRAESAALDTLILGRDPDYARAFDLDVQTELADRSITCSRYSTEIIVAKSFEEFKSVVRKRYGAVG